MLMLLKGTHFRGRVCTRGTAGTFRPGADPGGRADLWRGGRAGRAGAGADGRIQPRIRASTSEAVGIAVEQASREATRAPAALA
ncbi:hypothetical protein GCM10012287_18710 [Streptomyces daqingensis]|uniref:Uncharacterized protein n=1 Tax=Streptomyces daqingensis TaxID=1472640 RepID=A0ABQ2M4E8_9ACTN|nr:hypothetical protein GCM10012287_18710 [Streptomyces daqingensis]